MGWPVGGWVCPWAGLPVGRIAPPFAAVSIAERFPTSKPLEEAVPWQHAMTVSQLETGAEYQQLRDLNLHTRPAGCMLGVQPAVQVWCGYGGDSVHFARSWEGKKKHT